MMTSNVKKLCLYSIDCIKSCSKSSLFNNLKSSKENKILITDVEKWQADNKIIVELMTKQALNKSTMTIYKGQLMAEGKNIYSPLLYTEAKLIRNGDIIELIYDDDNYNINFGLISSLLENDEDAIENIITQLLEIEHPEKIDFVNVLKGLIDIDNKLTIKKENAIILAKNQESIAGLLSELKQIASEY